MSSEGEHRSRRTSTAFALIAGLLILVLALVVVLSGSPVVLARTNGVLEKEKFAEVYNAAGACQSGEVLPAGTSAIRLGLESGVGPRLHVTVSSGTHTLTAGAVGSGWISATVTVPVRPVSRTVANVRVCFAFGRTGERVALIGSPTSPTVAARASEGLALPGRITIEYLRPGNDSWWSLTHDVARRMGLGRAPSGGWIVLLLLAFMGAIVTVSSWLVLRESP
ncbi:MAG TPA: hypothetical protein VK730_14230 [Solirubrobacteraceae bacterium]|jgi:hypothetical protein|nr:hypothetical protein [Solirubrobacteraceae bacterium]